MFSSTSNDLLVSRILLWHRYDWYKSTHYRGEPGSERVGLEERTKWLNLHLHLNWKQRKLKTIYVNWRQNIAYWYSARCGMRRQTTYMRDVSAVWITRVFDIPENPRMWCKVSPPPLPLMLVTLYKLPIINIMFFIRDEFLCYWLSDGDLRLYLNSGFCSGSMSYPTDRPVYTPLF